MNEDRYEGKITGREFLPNDNSGGMMITGTWMNKRTGQKVNVRQSVQDGDNMIIITDKGQLSMDVFSRDYIQASDEVYNESGQVIDNKPMEMNIDINDIINYEQGITTVSTPIQQTIINTEQNPNDKIIKKVFDKLTSFPEVTVDIKWDEFPTAQISTLVDFLDVKIEDITKYIIKNYINNKALSESIKKILNEKLKKSNSEVDIESEED